MKLLASYVIPSLHFLYDLVAFTKFNIEEVIMHNN